AVETIKDAGLRSFIKTAMAVPGHGENTVVADKYRRLEDLPDGSWGRQVATMYATYGWPYPGEKHGAPEMTAQHDWVHVLSGYPPTPVGELQVNTYMAVSSDDPMSFGGIFLAMSLYGLGGISLPIGNFTSQGGAYDRPDIGALFSEAVNRSAAVRVDFFDFDHWGSAKTSVEQLREQYEIPAKTVDIGDPDPGLASPPA
ncbi:MAG: hypothetical protein HQ526_09070, partial [Actinobacteria bacterium]|nr:hypothetical protein [Actinomycetota bacterium]